MVLDVPNSESLIKVKVSYNLSKVSATTKQQKLGRLKTFIFLCPFLMMMIAS